MEQNKALGNKNESIKDEVFKRLKTTNKKFA